MKSEEDKDTKEEESEYEEEEDIKKIEDLNLNEIVIVDDEGLKGHVFNKEKCIENQLLEEDDSISLYSNLYPIEFTKDIEICEYPFIIKPECHEESVILKILREASPYLFKTYGYYYRSGNSFFAVKRIEEDKVFRVVIVYRGMLQYTITVKATPRSTTIEKGKKHDFEEFEEKVLFLVIREILSANPNVHFDRDNLYLENRKEKIEGYNNTYYIHDGYKISMVQANIGLCLIIGVKNKIKGKFTVLDFINNSSEEEIENLSGRRFIPFEGSRSLS